MAKRDCVAGAREGGAVRPAAVAAGVIDPTKVVARRFRTPVPSRGLLLTTEALVSEDPEEKKPSPAPAGHDMDY